ncbi:phytanoyl-CoA dioxygenase family protein [Pseudonocardia pini]|uniref:phytanoyl-CoA dioxygenase family protein n=1 Tax=Pseudonocardia pini TaxID=2758030 RepID=UPI0015F004CD|nr:phytanoyl-CoA dioxygenase family protein [Pseudonocardia pini]
MTTSISRVARAITADEAAEVEANGWALLPGYVGAEQVHSLRRGAESLLGLAPDGAVVRPSAVVRTPSEVGRRTARTALRVFGETALDPELGRNAGRVVNRPDSIVLVEDEVNAARDQQPGAPAFHAGASSYQLDTTFGFTWIALTDIDADQGAPVFVSGSHRLGLVGLGFYSEETMAGWDRLPAGSVSAPQAMKAGDAVVARSETIRAFPPNTTDRVAITYALVHAPATTTYIGWPIELPGGTEIPSHQLLTEAGLPIVHHGEDRDDWRRTQGAKG